MINENKLFGDNLLSLIECLIEEGKYTTSIIASLHTAQHYRVMESTITILSVIGISYNDFQHFIRIIGLNYSEGP
jgi:hypothetical protein